ncbi:MAG: hypothetical protein IJA70_03305 [Oscillospiraceae bacterium]|nr:hypothetical protein [Oscillospiraceae bacterium]MBQ4642921.1 hypothetical protein [Oscillospiraceae bacterium]
MKKIISILLVMLMLCSCAAIGGKTEFVEGITSPPAVKVQYGDVSITAGKGSYSWDYIENGKNMCVEAEADHPLFWEDIASFSAGTEKSANLIFDERMESYELKRWEVEPGYFESEDYSILDKGETVISENGVFEVPADGKMYVYELYVKYEGGGNCWYGFRIDSPDDWGLTLSVSDVTATGLTVIFTQSGGNPTGELMTGSYYRLESADGELAYIAEGDVAWTSEAYMIPKDGSVSMSVNWEWLYGALEPGTYKIFKGVSDFRGPGDYDDREYSAEFTVGEKAVKNISIMKIVDGAESGYLVLAGENPGEVMTLNVKDISVFLDGKEADSSAIMDGMTAHIYHNGEILETYPASFGKVNRIDVFSIGTKNQLGGTLFDLCGLYLKVLDDLWKTDSGLNGGAEYVSIDLSEAPGGLTEAEKSAICWIFENKHGVMAFDFTFEELKEKGYLTAAGGSDNLYQWDNGVLMTITNAREESEKPDAYFGLRTIEFDAMKWRSPLGAYFFDNCTATWPQMGTWTDYNVGAHAIA